jgi:hypothetical protein
VFEVRMADPNPTFFARLWLALICLVRCVYDVRFAAGVAAVREQLALPPGEQPQALQAPQPPAALPPPFVGAGPVALTPGTAAQAAAAEATAAPKPAPVAPAAPAAPAVDPNAQALHLLSVLQREGRLLDFVEEELAGFSDATIGAAARTVHAGCRKALRANFELQAVRPEAEGAPVELAAGFDAAAIRLTGNVVGNPPFKGVLRHHGWRAAAVKLGPPSSAHAATLLAPAEVELP